MRKIINITTAVAILAAMLCTPAFAYGHGRSTPDTDNYVNSNCTRQDCAHQSSHSGHAYVHSTDTYINSEYSCAGNSCRNASCPDENCPYVNDNSNNNNNNNNNRGSRGHHGSRMQASTGSGHHHR